MNVLFYRFKEAIKTSRISPLLRFLKGLTRKATTNDLYDFQTQQILKTVLTEESSCIDIGANRGDILKLMVKYAPNGSHLAFEPLPHYCKLLKRIFPKVSVYNMALSDVEGTSDFKYVVNAPGYSGLRKRVYHIRKAIIENIRVQVKRLDDVVPDSISPNFIKIDTEGSEYNILRGALKLILRAKPILLFEAGKESTGQYGVKPEDFYTLICSDMSYMISTMNRYLSKSRPLTLAEFVDNWHSGTEYYFLAYPIKKTTD
ncbi:MAG: FkbM family methyltransferase [Bacteroidetes bacterium]|nr:FkbM family methyltransferase [Bacteroidota bacterium]